MTIKDIARLSGVSVSTVSRVLNERPDVSVANREKVLTIIQKHNYIPNNSARDLVKTTSDSIGLVVRGISNPFYTNIIHAIETNITKAGYTMVMQQIDVIDDEIKAGAMMERDKRLLGIIFLGGRFDYTPADLSFLNVPFVCCAYSNRYGTVTDEEYSSVSIADEETAYIATKILLEHGHRRIAALVASTHDRSISQLRYKGYIRALEEADISIDKDLTVCAHSFDLQDSYLAVKKALSDKMDMTAMVSISDNMSIGAMKALREAGKKIPDDCSIISIDGIEVANYLEPALTTLCQPMEQMGECSVNILLDMINNHTAHQHVILPTYLQKGGSLVSI